ncbi:MAG: acyl-[acyl-carrier-protein] thioesterase, partial [Fimbriimonadaceae bacterium]|nr:acyl-[acyl-carrier-protein] thioesterase [Alphaproteobacteria bacterium]
MKQAVETGRQFVNTWECDENNHMNVQYYFQHFENADSHFWNQVGLTNPAIMPVTQSQHVRFHKELKAGDLIVLNSHLAPHKDGFALCHVMTDAENGDLTATSWAPLSDTEADVKPYPGAPIFEAVPTSLPRSFKHDPAAQPTLDDAQTAGFAVSLRNVVQPLDCGANGLISARGVVANLSNAASHFWSHIGLNKSWLNANNYGRVAIEFKLSRLTNLAAGTPIVVLSGLTDFSHKTISFRHYIFDLITKEAVLAADVAGLAIDLQSRRA